MSETIKAKEEDNKDEEAGGWWGTLAAEDSALPEQRPTAPAATEEDCEDKGSDKKRSAEDDYEAHEGKWTTQSSQHCNIKSLIWSLKTVFYVYFCFFVEALVCTTLW